MIATYSYNELGQLQNKTLGNNLENLAYAYNIRGWLSTINKNYISGSSTSNYFGMELGYDKTTSVNTTTSYARAQYTGDITGTIWRTKGDGVGRKYDYTYDSSDRLTAAAFVQNTSGSSWDNSTLDFSMRGISYDANGNILTLSRKGFKLGGSTNIDSLVYTYAGTNTTNRLTGVTDAANDTTAKLGDFQYNPATKQTTDYTYDGNGNLLSDNNRVINAITYNFLNLQQQFHVNGKGNIQYVYDASGTTLQKTVIDSAGNKKTITTYIGGFIYQSTSTLTATGSDTLQMVAHEEGRIRWAFHKYTTGTIAYKYEYDFFLRDNQNNTRVILTQQKDTAKYIATMEAAYRSTELALFNNITTSCYARSLISGYPTDNTTTPNDSVAHLNGSAQKTGPSLLLKVMSGDSIDLGVHSYYVTQTGTGTNSSITDVMSSLASGLVSITGGTKGSVSQLTNPAGTLYSAISSFLTNSDPNPTGKPKAYLNWILLDDQLNPVSTYPQTGAITVGNYTQATLGTPGQTGIPITKSGYLYVWVSNETAGWDVYFDNLSVTHHTGPLLEENHYYPFGLAMAAISSKALKTNYYENKFRFNGGSEMQNKEFSDGSGLEMYETPMRGYDAQIGRFGQIDPMAASYLEYSGYAYCTNNPILFSDPTGARKFYFAAPQVFGSLSGGMDAPPLESGGGAQSYWSSGSSGNSGMTDAQSAVTALLSDAYANGGTWKNNGNGEGTITGFNSTDDAVIGGVSYLFYSGALGSGATAQQTANNLVSQYNDANGGHAEGTFESLNAVTVIGHISSSGGWVTTNEADVAAQLRANGASYNGSNNQEGIINIYRTWETDNSTIDKFFTGSGLNGYILEPPGPSTTQSGQRLRIPEGSYNLIPSPGTAKDIRLHAEWELYNDLVPSSRNILFHLGNYPKNTDGCLLVGFTRSVDFVGGNSMQATDALNSYINSFNGRVTVNIYDPSKPK